MTTLRRVPASVELCLNEWFGLTSFRPLQREIIDEMLARRPLFATLRSGEGKSLCYQLPAMMRPSGVTVVISPLVALMHDQVHTLAKRRVPATYIDSTRPDQERADVVARVRQHEFALLYLSPETLNTKRIYDELDGVTINWLIVDEAHCVSMWGHDFRPEYLKIRQAQKRFGNPPLAAFTATSPVRVRDDVVRSLGVEGARQFQGEIDRPNITLDIRRFGNDREKSLFLFGRLRDHVQNGELTVVYCRRITVIEELAKALKKAKVKGFRIYHGQLEREERLDVERALAKGKVSLLLATKAFGMGVDIPSIRRVYHYQLPESLEEYWQEVGRAGRDGLPAEAVLLYDRFDVATINGFLRTSNPPLDFVKRVYNRLWQQGLSRHFSKDGSQRVLFMRRFIDGWADGNPHAESMVTASLAVLEEAGVIATFSNSLQFLVTPKEIEASGQFPISRQLLDTKADAARLRVRAMLYYANSSPAQSRGIILHHFRDNTVVPQVEKMAEEVFYKVDEEVCRIIVEGLLDSDRLASSYPGYLNGTNAEQGRHRRKLSAFKLSEVRMDVTQVATLGLIREVPIREGTWLTLTDRGLELLNKLGVSPRRLTKFADLRKLLYSPEAKAALQSALQGWFNYFYSMRLRTDQWWPKLREFRVEMFTVLDKRVSGGDLVAAYVRRRKAADTTLTEAKDLLNYLFDNKIAT